MAHGSEDCIRIKGAMQRHALAAMCLHGQEFGFDWEMVEFLRLVAGDYREQRTQGAVAKAGYLKGIADRIQALLPPRETS